MELITVFTRDDFKKWLEKHHATEEKVAVIVYRKHTGKPSPSHHELMGEAICHGWIDTTLKKLDEDRYVRNFSQRNKNSKWSDNTLRYGKELLEQGKMTLQGLQYYKEGLQKPMHDAGIPKNPTMPESLKKALSLCEVAKKNFEKFPPSTKKMLYRWILRGKREETRARRIKLIIERCKVGRKDIM